MSEPPPVPRSSSCSRCGASIQPAANFCPSCGAAVDKSPKLGAKKKHPLLAAFIGLSFIGLIVVIVYAISTQQTSDTKQSDDPAQQAAKREKLLAEQRAEEAARAEIKRRIDIMLKSGILQRIDPESHKAWVNPIAWHIADAEQKENLTRIMATYCSPGYPEIEIYDGQSAKKIAGYGPWSGFKVY